MICLIQRVISSYVEIDGKIYSSISRGLNILAGISKGDDEKDINQMVDKIINLRIFSNENGKFNFSLKDINGEVLIISQFTLLGNSRKGRRPDFTLAMDGENAKRLYELFINKFKESYIPEKVKTGIFKANMKVNILNDGPVTIILNTKEQD